jgi:hypothetical protein
MSNFKEFLRFIIQRKKYVLLPLFFALFFLGGLLVLAGNPTVSPFLYALF